MTSEIVDATGTSAHTIDLDLPVAGAVRGVLRYANGAPATQVTGTTGRLVLTAGADRTGIDIPTSS